MKQKYTRYGGKKACKYATKTRQCPTLKIRQSTGFSSCDPDATRTHDRLLRRQMLYPAELPDPQKPKPHETVFYGFPNAKLHLFGHFAKYRSEFFIYFPYALK